MKQLQGKIDNVIYMYIVQIVHSTYITIYTTTSEVLASYTPIDGVDEVPGDGEAAPARPVLLAEPGEPA